ncbi:hypothetical protein [Flagellimonas lutaonensis]|uniref:Secreted protein n=1 Tax=Flagellimonas lutaonensis TaxID=516051 RepID=A0A0D5YR38_9FLAO|nr:hypothetical protein [Allomuricauda lutaonensis]AKA34353.1 Secreted protein [Allomuricauda lutaonensis]
MKLFSTFLLFLITASVFSQAANDVEKHQFKINMLNPGVEYEVRLATNQTLDFGAGLQFGARGGEGYFDWVFVPAFNAQYRHYYNMKRRIGKGKTISGNSANYIALANTTFINESIIGNTVLSGGYFGYVGPVYGLQRTYPKGFNIGFKIGFGYYYDDFYEGEFGPVLGFSIGWVIRGNRK